VTVGVFSTTAVTNYRFQTVCDGITTADRDATGPTVETLPCYRNFAHPAEQTNIQKRESQLIAARYYAIAAYAVMRCLSVCVGLSVTSVHSITITITMLVY